MQSNTAQDESAATAESAKSDEDILEIARRRFDLAAEAEAPIRALSLEDMEFAAGKQWPDDVEAARAADNRPCLTINRIPQFIRQITNDQRQNRPSVKVSPVDDKADIDTAKILQGIIRHVEYSSDADTAYDTAFDRAVRGGFGYFRIVTEYCDPNSFDLDIRIRRIRNPMNVYLDPHYQQPDGSDSNWGFIFEEMSADDYRMQFPKSDLISMEDWESLGDQRPGWVTKDTVRVAEYFYKEFQDTEIYLLSDKSVVTKDQLPQAAAMGLEVVAARKTLIPVVKWCKINGVEILEKTDWPGRWIPIIPVLGDELDIDGKRVLEGIVRHAKDSQRMYNYWKSSETETIALAPRAPWIGVEGQFEGHEGVWQTANVRNHPYLEYKPKTVGGQPAGPPTRNVFEPPVQAITQASMYAAEDLKATTGIYDAAMGAQSNEKSGIAIQRRAAQAQTSNFHFIDNLSKSIRHCGRQLVDLIPKVYDTERAVRILGEDGSEEVVKINAYFEKGGKQVRYDLGAGKYDVTVSTGPSFETKRQEAVVSMTEMSRAFPPLMQVAGDIMVKNMDWPGAQDIAERIRKTLPPGVADDKEKQPVPPEAQAQMGQMGQMIEQLTEQLKEKTHLVETKTLELESRERIEMAKLQMQAEIEMAKMGSAEAIVLLKTEIAQIENRLNLLRQNEPISQDSNPAGESVADTRPIEQLPTDGFSSGQTMEQIP